MEFIICNQYCFMLKPLFYLSGAFFENSPLNIHLTASWVADLLARDFKNEDYNEMSPYDFSIF